MNKWHTGEIENDDDDENKKIEKLQSNELWSHLLLADPFHIRGILRTNEETFKDFLNRRELDAAAGPGTDVRYEFIDIYDDHIIFQVEVDFFEKILQNRAHTVLFDGSFRAYDLIDNEDATTTLLQRELEDVEETFRVMQLFPERDE